MLLMLTDSLKTSQTKWPTVQNITPGITALAAIVHVLVTTPRPRSPAALNSHWASDNAVR